MLRVETTRPAKAISVSERRVRHITAGGDRAELLDALGAHDARGATVGDVV